MGHSFPEVQLCMNISICCEFCQIAVRRPGLCSGTATTSGPNSLWLQSRPSWWRLLSYGYRFEKMLPHHPYSTVKLFQVLLIKKLAKVLRLCISPLPQNFDVKMGGLMVAWRNIQKSAPHPSVLLAATCTFSDLCTFSDPSSQSG